MNLRILLNEGGLTLLEDGDSQVKFSHQIKGNEYADSFRTSHSSREITRESLA